MIGVVTLPVARIVTVVGKTIFVVDLVVIMDDFIVDTYVVFNFRLQITHVILTSRRVVVTDVVAFCQSSFLKVDYTAPNAL